MNESKGYREVCDWCELGYVGLRVAESAQVGHGKLCPPCRRAVDAIAKAGSANPGLTLYLAGRQALI